jgi:hypothetical protein
MTSFNLNYLLKTLSPNTVTLGFRLSSYKFMLVHNTAFLWVRLLTPAPDLRLGTLTKCTGGDGGVGQREWS